MTLASAPLPTTRRPPRGVILAFGVYAITAALKR
jgi:hypothetical protein